MKAAVALLLLVLSISSMAQSIPRPEHPRPDLRRDEWTNLNGPWEFAETDDDNDMSWLSKKEFPDKIIVPFCRESKLSGLERKGFVRNVWYRRKIEIPQGWRSKRYLLHIGASDWKTTVWVNGTKLAVHTGGQSPIDVDVTSALSPSGNEVIVHAFDDTRSGLQALGKQCPALDSYGCLYTRTTGIWQSVWFEGVGRSYVSHIDVLKTDAKQRELQFRAQVAQGEKGQHLVLEVFHKGKFENAIKVPVTGNQANVNIKVKNPELWAPGHPELYDIKLTLLNESGTAVDWVSTYTAFREVKMEGRAILINGQRVFQRLVLDQGFYPDGVWTAPTDAALKHDIEMSMAAGFNGARLHQKVFEPRYLYWADKLGYLVWGEYPNWGMNYTDPRAVTPVLGEWADLLRRDMMHPAIVGWCPFNETPPDAIPFQNKVVSLIKATDPSRPVIDSSGYAHDPNVTPVLDAHDYDQNPKTFKGRWDGFFGENTLPNRYAGTSSPTVPFMVSEYGGIGWDTTGGWGYGDGPKTLEQYYTRFKGLSDALLDNPNMFGFCYTQITDVEQERNGIYKYDRTPKFDAKRLHAILARPAAYETVGPSKVASTQDTWKVLVGSARDALPGAWKSTFAQPGTDWNKSDFADAFWYVSPGGFGAKGGFEADIETPWTTSDIWLRRTFQADSAKFSQALLAIHYDNAAEVYLNGRLVWKSAAGAWNDGYDGMDVTQALKKTLKKGVNVIAVHCHQDTGGQFIDLALLVR